MFKLELAPLIYYFDDEKSYDWAKNLLEIRSPVAAGYQLLMQASICINTELDTIVKHREKTGIKDLIEKSITLEDPRQEITIVVNGGCGTGKTRIAALINSLLHERGFMTGMEFKEENPCDVYHTLDIAIEDIKKKVKIVVKEKTLSRSGMLQ